MTIRDYILSDEELEKLRTKTTRKKRHMQVNYHVLFQSGCDFGIEKKCGIKVSRLIILVSKKQYYVMEGNTAKALTVPRLKDFLKDLDSMIKLQDVYWLSGLCNDQMMPGRILKALRSQCLHDLLKKGTTYVYSDQELCCRQSECRDDFFDYRYMYDPINEVFEDQSFYNWVVNYLAERRNMTKKILFRDLIGLEIGKKETMLLKSFDAFRYLRGMYGIEWGKAAVEKYMSSSVEDAMSRRHIETLFDAFAPQSISWNSVETEDWFDFDTYERKERQNKKEIIKRLPAKKTLEYMIYHSCREGYAFSMDEFFTDWIQYLRRQKEIYGKIEDKYPDHLKSSLKRLDYEYKLYEEEISQKQWIIAAEKMKGLEFKDDVYMIKSPCSKEELAQEASHQHNCVLDYADKVKRGEEYILFLRKCEEEEKPLVTLEVLPGGRVGQVFRAFNASPSADEMKFLAKWAKEKNLVMPENPLPPRGANNVMNNDLNGNVFGF